MSFHRCHARRIILSSFSSSSPSPHLFPPPRGPWSMAAGTNFQKSALFVIFHISSFFRRTLISENFHQHLLGRLCWRAPGQNWRLSHRVWGARPVPQDHNVDTRGHIGRAGCLHVCVCVCGTKYAPSSDLVGLLAWLV